MTNFPKSIILPTEADNIRHELRRVVQRVQSSYLALKNNPDFTLPQSFDELSAEYSRNFYRPFLEAIAKDFTLEEDKRQKLKNRWGRIQAATTQNVNVVCDGIKATPQLKWIFDEAMQMPTPTAKLDEIADQMATKPINEKAARHYDMVQAAKQAYDQLRRWEDENGVSRWPLKNLFSLDVTRFAEQWAAKQFEMAEAPDTATGERWRIINQSIF